MLLGATVVTFLPGSRSPDLAHLPISGAIGKQRSFLRCNRAVRALFAALLHLHSRNQTAVDAWEHHGGFRLFHVLTSFLRLLNAALNQSKIAVGIGIRSGAHYFGLTAGQSVLFLFDHLYQCFHAIGIAAEGTRGGAHGGSVQLHSFLFNVLVRFEMSVRPAALDRLPVEGAIAALGAAFDGAHGIRIFAVRVGCSRPGLVRVARLGIGSLCPKRGTGPETGTETRTKPCHDRDQHARAQTRRTGRARAAVVPSTVHAWRSPVYFTFGDICGWHAYNPLPTRPHCSCVIRCVGKRIGYVRSVFGLNYARQR